VIAPGGGFLPESESAPLPHWLTEEDLDFYAGQFGRTGFTGGLNWYRAMNLTWELTGAYNGAQVTQPALFIAGKEDGVLSIPGMDAVVANLAQTVPGLRDTLLLDGCGHWVQQERPGEVNRALLAFLGGLAGERL
jgi:pimeloyl-ACP methyl ester carboxylesterase